MINSNLNTSVAEPEYSPSSAESHPCYVVGKIALIVDDDMSILTLNSAILGRMGMLTHVADSGRDALSLFASHKTSISVAILDIDMPGIDGIELCKKLRRTCGELPVVFASGSGSPDLATRLEPLKPISFLPKPYGAEDLQKSVLTAVCKTRCDRYQDCMQDGPPVGSDPLC